MQRAIELAKLSASEHGTDIPVGALIIKDGNIIAEATNQREELNDITAHAEILALKQASEKLGNWRLDNCEMYVTLEPCPMCAWAILQARINKIYYGSHNPNYGAFGSALDLPKQSDTKIKIFDGIMQEECDKILQDFWITKRH